MTRGKLLLRNLWFFRAGNLAVIAGMAVATAVLTGALLVGDSVRESLKQLAVERLGPVDHVMVSPRFFPQDLGERIAKAEGFANQFEMVVPAISLRGGAGNEGELQTAGVQVMAVGSWVTPPSGRVIVNPELSGSLDGLGAGKTIRLLLPKVDDTPREATLARNSRDDVTSGMRATVERVSAARGMESSFNLAGGQRAPRNAWVNLSELQNTIEQPKRVNMLLVQAKAGRSTAEAAEKLSQMLRSVATLEDYGLSIDRKTKTGEVVINSGSTFILPGIDRAATAAGEAVGVTPRRASVYLVNRVSLATGKKIHYAIAASLSGIGLKDDEVAINQWTADQLGAKLGDAIDLAYYQRQRNGNLDEVTTEGQNLTFKVARILPMEGIGADPSLTPTYPGLTDADSVADWDPPEGVAIDKKLVTKADEAYWDDHQAAPKLFVNLDVARKLWGNVYGDVNSIRVPADKADAFAAELRKRIDPATLGMSFIPIKHHQLAAARGNTDFSGLFVGFSFFLIVSAVLLVAMLFRLNIEQRARQYGLLGALGFAPTSLRRMAMLEGLLLATIGAAAGIVLAIGYTRLMLHLLTTRWVGAVGTTAMTAHVRPSTLLIGFAASVVVAMIAIAWGAWRLRKADTTALLAGGWGLALRGARPGRLLYLLGLPTIVLALLLFVVGHVKRDTDWAQWAVLAGGGLLLCGLLVSVGSWLGRPRRSTPRRWTVPSLGIRNASRNRGRSALTMGLIAFASFVLVIVAAFKATPDADAKKPRDGTGKFELIVQSDIALSGDLNTVAGRKILNVRDPDDPLWSAATFMPLRTWAGQDISCLNMTRPDSPTILGVPPAMAERNSFAFADDANHWPLLERVEPDGAIPVITDAETAQYIIKLKIGDTLPINDQLGRPQKLRLVATLSHSIFQGEMLMGEENFLRLFPTQGGYNTVLVDAADGKEADVRKLIATELADFAVTIERTTDRLARYQQVANTYLQTFQTLGSLGLLLGTIGLAVILMRSLVERRGELSLLTSLGFSRFKRFILVLSENAFLLIMGLAIGAGSALLGILPALRTPGRDVNLSQLIGTLAAILVAGLLALALTLLVGGRRIRLSALRQE